MPDALTQPNPHPDRPGPKSRAQALDRIGRRRRFRTAVAIYLIGSAFLVVMWAVTEYHNAGGWPTGLRSGRSAQDWDPWIVYPLITGSLALAVHGWITFGRRPVTERQIEQEIGRLAPHTGESTGPAAIPGPINVLAADLEDPHWDGIRVPEQARCDTPGARSPAIRVRSIPNGADLLLLAFSDVDFAPMSAGGHGILGYHIPPGATEVLVPPVPELAVDDLPDGVEIIAHNRGRTRQGYRSPCGGGSRPHRYELIISAVRRPNLVAALAETRVELGTLQ